MDLEVWCLAPDHEVISKNIVGPSFVLKNSSGDIYVVQISDNKDLHVLFKSKNGIATSFTRYCDITPCNNFLIHSRGKFSVESADGSALPPALRRLDGMIGNYSLALSRDGRLFFASSNEAFVSSLSRCPLDVPINDRVMDAIFSADERWILCECATSFVLVNADTRDVTTLCNRGNYHECGFAAADDVMLVVVRSSDEIVVFQPGVQGPVRKIDVTCAAGILHTNKHVRFGIVHHPGREVICSVVDLATGELRGWWNDKHAGEVCISDNGQWIAVASHKQVLIYPMYFYSECMFKIDMTTKIPPRCRCRLQLFFNCNDRYLVMTTCKGVFFVEIPDMFANIGGLLAYMESSKMQMPGIAAVQFVVNGWE